MKYQTYIFSMDAETALQVYELFDKLELKTERQRTVLLSVLAASGWNINVSATKRTKDEYAKDMSKMFNVLDLRHKNPEGGDSPNENGNNPN